MIVLNEVMSVVGHYLPWRVWRRIRAQRSCPHHDADGAGSWLRSGVFGVEGPPGYRWCTVCSQQWWHFANAHNPE